MHLDGESMFPQRWMNERKGYEERDPGMSPEQYAYVHVLGGLAANPELAGSSPEVLVERARAIVRAAR